MNLDVSTDSGMSFVYDKINDKMAKEGKNPLVLAVLMSIVVLYVLLFNVMGNPTVKTQSNQSSNKFIELFAWGLFLL